MPEETKTEERIQKLEREVEELRSILFKKTGSNPSGIATNDFKSDVIRIKLGNLLGFYGVTEVDQPETVADATTQSLTGVDTIDQTKLESDLNNHKVAINLILDRLQELGLIK